MVNIYVAVAISLGFGICTYWWGRHRAVEPTIENVLGIFEKGNYIKNTYPRDKYYRNPCSNN